jgi:chemotaxis response regulator CheB
LVKTLGLIKELTLTGTEKPIPVMMVGGLDRKEGEQAFERLKTAATQYLEQPIELLCWVGATSLGELSTQETDTTVKKKDLLLPAGLFKQMANKIAS